nr:hypothetical protein [Candidatus Dactylopiibacterium carminicum]
MGPFQAETPYGPPIGVFGIGAAVRGATTYQHHQLHQPLLPPAVARIAQCTGEHRQPSWLPDQTPQQALQIGAALWVGVARLACGQADTDQCDIGVGAQLVDPDTQPGNRLGREVAVAYP